MSTCTHCRRTIATDAEREREHPSSCDSETCWCIDYCWNDGEDDCDHEPLETRERGLTGTPADKYHDALIVIDELEEAVEEAIHYATGDADYGLEVSSDYYDNSLEVSLRGPMFARPWEPSREARDALLALGFEIVYWNFDDGTEIRGDEPRRRKAGPHRYVEGVGYVDDDWTG